MTTPINEDREKQPLLHLAGAPREVTFPESKQYSNTIGYSVMINYIIGSGVFSLPFAFYTAGSLLTIGCMLVFAVISIICLMWTIEILARAEGVTAILETSVKQNGKVVVDMARKPVHEIKFRKFDFTLIAELFGGVKLKIFTQVCIFLYCYGALWSYVSVFGSSVTSLFFEYALGEPCDTQAANASTACHSGYYITVAIYALFVVFVSLKDLSDTSKLQLVLTGYRFSAFAAMVITVWIALFQPNVFDPTNSSSSPPYISYSGLGVKWVGFGTAFTFSAVALNVHYNMPDVVQPLKDKSKLRMIAVSGLLTAVTFYIFIGMICALLFGSATNALVTLNWNSYIGVRGGWDAADVIGHAPWWATVIKLWIMLFPVLNMLSVFPLVAVTLGENIAGSLPEPFRARRPKLARIGSRLVAAIPPLILGAVIPHLSFIINFTGLIGFALELTIPALVQVLSQKYCTSRWGEGSEHTPYSSFISSSILAWIVFAISIVGFLFSFIDSYFPNVFA